MGGWGSPERRGGPYPAPPAPRSDSSSSPRARPQAPVGDDEPQGAGVLVQGRRAIRLSVVLSRSLRVVATGSLIFVPAASISALAEKPVASPVRVGWRHHPGAPGARASTSLKTLPTRGAFGTGLYPDGGFGHHILVARKEGIGRSAVNRP